MKDGRVWKKSQISKITLLANEFCAHKEPTTMPMDAETMTEKEVIPYPVNRHLPKRRRGNALVMWDDIQIIEAILKQEFANEGHDRTDQEYSNTM